MAVASAKLKEKTKAKKRYLRRKKDRRKKSKGKASTPRAPGIRDSTDSFSDEDVATANDHEVGIVQAVANSGSNEDTVRRPKKRRRLSDIEPPNEDVTRMDVDELAKDEQIHSDHLIDTEQHLENTADDFYSQPTLPSFPMPALPDAPSKADLAMQGLDQALVEAELIDPTHVLPIPSEDKEDTVTGLSHKMRRRLKELGIQELFAVQTSLLPFLLQRNSPSYCLYTPYDPPRDVCVSAPTGSGKTLAYAIPIVEILSSRIVTRLRALIVLPTRDLVIQVRETFEAILKGRGLKIGTATGQHSFAHEQSQLVADQSHHKDGGSSKVDILICTPGRLIDHLTGTRNFSLQHLRFLVIDEADRLLAQSFQGWLSQVLAATRPPDESSVDMRSATSDSLPIDSVAPAYSRVLPFPDIPTILTERKEASCQKLLFSATLTRDPGKIAALDLREPKYFAVQERKLTDDGTGVLSLVMEKFSMPSTLKEHMLVCETSLKPLLFFYLVHARSVVNSLVFTKSTESTMRLVQLFEYFEEAWTAHTASISQKFVACAYSSDFPASERKTILEKFRAQEIQMYEFSFTLFTTIFNIGDQTGLL
ncbi:hypothetical protein AX17_007315 [Amanita inopinata Kibby_2008]|nr:hypothetical protein AX17_007315 [Amanita inopinata Kibby_2008]